MLSFLFAVIFAGIVDSHSILRIPQSWNTRESKSSPCGGRNAAQGAQVTPTAVTPGADVTGRWQVTAGDGNGPISITFVETEAEVTNAGFAAARAKDPPQTLAVAMNPTPQRGTGTYDFTFKAPPASANCRGGAAGNQCYIQVKSTSNWYSCATLTMPPAPTPAPIPAVTSPPTRSPTQTPPPTPATCTTLQDTAVASSICAGLNGKSIKKDDLQSVAEKLNLAIQEFSASVSNGIIFRNSKSNNLCQQWLAQYTCSQRFENCDIQSPALTKNVCKSRCLNTMYECDVDPLHESALLINTCGSSQFSELTADAYGPCPALPTARRVHLKTISVGVEPTYWAQGNTYPTQRIYKGDKLVWKYQNIKLYKFPSAIAFETCEFSTAVEQAGTTDTTQEGGPTVFTLDTSNSMYSVGETLYYGSTPGCIPNESKNSLKVAVEIVALPTGATVVSETAGSPAEERPDNFPTQSPPGFLGNPGIEDSGSLERYSICFFALVCSLLVILQ